MPRKRKFLSVQDVIKTYFPDYSQKHQETTDNEDLTQTVTDLAEDLAEEFEASLGKRRSNSGEKVS